MRLKVLLSVALLMCLTACVSNDIYYWGGYEKSALKYSTHPNSQNAESHFQQLTQIVHNAQGRGKKVPPGVRFELGLLEMSKGNLADAEAWFLAEQSSFPESSVIVAKMIARMKAQNSQSDEATTGKGDL